MNEIKIFTNAQFGQIRTVEVEGKPMFVASDIAKALGYAKPNNAVNDNCKHATRATGIIDSIGRPQEMAIIPESDIYRLVMRSKLPQAEAFQVWVCEDVLPSIRKHGAYMTPETVMQIFQNPDTLIQLLTTLKDEQEQNALLRVQKEADTLAIEVMQPKAEYFDTVLRSGNLIATNAIAAELGISAQKLNRFLCESGIQYKQGSLYFLYSDLRGKGLEGYKTFVRTDPDTGESKSIKHLYWTEKGTFFIIDLYRNMTPKLLN